ncbi:MAG: sugar transferase [Opitutaceae bacterium]|nr:sugar transferase [Cephaloticoccus sp.]MCP5531350.1 sugar transferase [Opitutaceae bacterium]
MLNRSHQQRIVFQQVADGLLAALAVSLAYGLRSWFPWLDLPDLENFGDYLWLMLLCGLLAPITLAQQQFYEPATLGSRIATIFKIMRGCAYMVLGLILFLFIVRVQYARSVIILSGTFASFLIYGRHELFQAFSGQAAYSALRKRALWLGKPSVIAKMNDALSASDRELFETVAAADPTDPAADLPALLHDRSINTVIVLTEDLPAAAIQQAIEACDREGVEILIPANIRVSSPSRLAVDQLGGLPAVYYRAQSARPIDLALKQAVDYIGAVLLLVLFSPLFVLCALLVRVSSRGPVIFKHHRAGLNGRPFVMYKFRTMQIDAERRRAELAHANEMSGPAFKMRRDPRITGVGRFLRRHSLDELPQLWNVLRGEMSLVGPRPLPLFEIEQIAENAQRRRLSVKPGLTCLWQIRGRNDISNFEDWVRLDLEYIDEWSLWLDLKILFATIPVALFGRGGR